MRNMDAAIDTFIKNLEGESVMVTGWVLVAATAEGALAGAPLGMVIASSDGLPSFSKTGLLESAARSLHDENMFLAWEDRQKGPKPPF
jgi:hypothetical protein